MKHFSLENDWDSIKGQLKQRYAQLTDNDMTFVSGKSDELLARLREKLGMSEHDLNALLEDLKSHASGRVEQVKAKAAGLADDMREKVGEVVGDLKTKGTAAAEEVKAQAGDAYGQARERARSLREDGEEYVRHNPRECLVAALCAGFVAGLLIRH